MESVIPGPTTTGQGYHLLLLLLLRVGLYQVLLKAGYPVLAVDYRGFGDSSRIPGVHEETVLGDARAVLRYVRESLGQEKVVVWGHSQGAAIAAHTVALEETRGQVWRLVLESPYTSLEDQATATQPWWQRAGVSLVGLGKADLQFQ